VLHSSCFPVHIIPYADIVIANRIARRSHTFYRIFKDHSSIHQLCCATLHFQVESKHLVFVVREGFSTYCNCWYIIIVGYHCYRNDELNTSDWRKRRLPVFSGLTF
jgi:hypothetical protein